MTFRIKGIFLLLIVLLPTVIIAQSWENPLFTAIKQKSLADIKKYIAQGYSVNEQDYAGRFPLEEAITKCCPVEILQYLVEQGADINPKIDSVNSEPPLLRAVGMQEASLETVQFLIKAGADIKATDHYGQTVLMIAAHRVEDVQIINFLIKAGADIHVKEKNGMTALHCAADSQKADTIRILLQAGADINAQTNNGDAPLIVALNTPASKYKAAEVLIKSGAKINIQNKDEMTALMCACKKNYYVAAIQLLLNSNADATLEDITGRTALDYFDSNKFIREDPIRKTLKNATYKK